MFVLESAKNKIIKKRIILKSSKNNLLNPLQIISAMKKNVVDKSKAKPEFSGFADKEKKPQSIV